VGSYSTPHNIIQQGGNIEDELMKSTVLNSMQIKSPVEYFNSFFDNDIFEKICTETNKFAFQDKGVELKCEV